MSPRPTRHGMVGWYDPKVLLQSAWMLTLSNIFGRHSDPRLIEALARQPQGAFDFAADEVGFDFVSDVGDGFNPTYAIASALAALNRTVLPPARGKITSKTNRGASTAATSASQTSRHSFCASAAPILQYRRHEWR